jgi:pimeloyl-ACP methyl ester carboxylesterase
LQAVDVLGFSIGGYIAQSLVLRYPDLVRRLVLAGTAPRNGELANDPRVPAVGANAVPTLVVSGKNDIMVPTINSFTLCQHIPNAQLIIYPDSGHGALFQYPKLFVTHTTIFLDS